MVVEIGSKMFNGRWMLVESGGERSVVNVRAVVNGDQARVGENVTLTSRGAEKKQATLIMTSDDRKFLEHQIKTDEPTTEENKPVDEDIVPDPNLYEEVRDFSPSGSSWGPDESRASSSSELDDNVEPEDSLSKRIKLESVQRQYTNSKKSQTPTLRPEPVVPKHLKEKLQKLKQISITNERGKRSQIMDRSGPSQSKKMDRQVTVSAEELKKVNRDLTQFKEMLKSLKNAVSSIRMTLSADHLYETVYASGVDDKKREVIKEEVAIEEYSINTTTDNTETVMAKDMRPLQAIKPITYGELRQNIKAVSREKEASSIVNHNNNVAKSKKVKRPKDNGSVSGASDGSDAAGKDMVSIGSGKTLVPRSIYNQINWNSYTMATRKLLMAVFPRRTLATHSLTGKASPAFQNKPAKLSLDPKKVFDIVITVTQKCNVKESLVRSAITTKCADENKMMRIQKEKKRKSTNCTPLRNRQNILEEESRNNEAHNQTQ